MTEEKFQRLVDIAETNVFWSGGVDYPWEGDALTTPEFIAALLRLATFAPADLQDQFAHIWEDK